MAAKKKGSQKPTDKIVLPYKKSHGGDAVKLYGSTGKKAQKWQSDLLKDMMAYNKDGQWVHTRFGYSVPRRNGKNEAIAARELWGLKNGERIAHTAHRTKTSRTGWLRLCDLLDKANIPYKSIRAEGRETITLKENGATIEFRTRSSKGGLGEGFDLLVIDEAQEYTDDQESALKYVVSDSRNPQTIFLGTPPTPISSGTVFTKYRRDTLAGAKVNAGWYSWEVHNEHDPTDKAYWYKTNPSLGTILSERAILDEVGDDVIDFNIQRLGLWIKYNQKSAITKGEWEALKVNKVPKLTGKLSIGIKYGHDGTNVAVSVAVRTTDGRNFVEAIDCQGRRNGNAWILDFIQNVPVGAIIVDGASGQRLLEEELKQEKLLKPILPTVKEVINANNIFEQCLTSGTICHMNQPALMQSVSNVEKRAIGSNGGFGYQSLNDGIEVALMESMILANWGLNEIKPKAKQRISY